MQSVRLEGKDTLISLADGARHYKRKTAEMRLKAWEAFLQVGSWWWELVHEQRHGNGKTHGIFGEHRMTHLTGCQEVVKDKPIG